MTAAIPEGYLGTSGRISEGPAPELIEAGYRLELGDAEMLHHGLHLADLAHVISLDRQRLMPEAAAPALLTQLLELGEVTFADFQFDVRLGDAYNSREQELVRRAGDLAGWVHLGRTRREAGRIAFRLSLRDQLLDLGDAVAAFTDVVADRAVSAAEVVWSDLTYLQPAQPSTFGHYLASFAEEAARHLPRLKAAYVWADISPAGSGGVGGTRMSLDRTGLADLLGFSAVGRNTRDTMWNLDGLVDAVTVAVQATLTASRLAEDLQIFASPGFGLVQLHASHCRASVLMPQKRNPYALAVIRAGAGTLVGRLTGLLTTCRTPSGQTDNWLHTYGEVTSSLALATRLLALARAVVERLELDDEALAQSAHDEQTAATDLADAITRCTGVDYRTSYRIVGRAVAVSLATGHGLSTESVNEAAAAVTGSDNLLRDGAVDVAAILDPVQAVCTRQELGGCGPAQVRQEMRALRPEVKLHRDWLNARRTAHREAETALVSAARAVVRAGTES
ncbi:lyase family protein [Nocardioides sp. CPCC 206347]|uniref:lyase family protein n=1 Tax=unclassified Nocardioides TaxID=2615069 RepID=UPI00361243F9